MTTPAPAFSGGWITGRFRGHYEAEAKGLVRTPEGLEIRTVRLLRGTLEQARFSPFGPSPEEAGSGRAAGPLRQAALDEVLVAAGSGEEGQPTWMKLALTDVWLCGWTKGPDELVGAWGLGELRGTLWGRLPGGEDAEVGEPEAAPDRIPAWRDA